jgi:hypothetical protein
VSEPRPTGTEAERKDPAQSGMPIPNQAAKHLTAKQLLEREKRFATRLKANARWTKRFLHDGR